MNSADLAREGFTGWMSFRPTLEQALLAQVPTVPGVFVVRRRQPYRRQRGESDLVYVGVGANRRGLNQRLRQVFHPGPTQSTNKRLLDLVADSGEYQVGFADAPTGEAARALKNRLLERYRRDHGELPPEHRTE